MDTTYHVTLFGLEMDIDRVAFTLPFGENGWPIYWYGILISLGFLLALIYAFRNTKRFGIDNDRLIDCILVTTPLAILGARAYYLLFDGGGIQGFKKFFSIHDGGLAIYGGVITAVAVGAGFLPRQWTFRPARAASRSASCMRTARSTLGSPRWRRTFTSPSRPSLTGTARSG